MNTIPVLPPITILAGPNASVIFRGEAFPIIKELFTFSSKIAAEQNRAVLSEFVVTSAVSRGSIQVFIDVCQGKSLPFDKSQILDLLLLCEE
jgi:hypothetical protein